MQIADYEKQLENLQKKQSVLKAKEKQLKAMMSEKKRAKENHIKMVLGGAVLGVLGEKVPTDRAELKLYGFALKAVFQKDKAKLADLIDTEFMNLLIEQEKKEQEEKQQEVQEENTIAENEAASTEQTEFISDPELLADFLEELDICK